MFKKLITLVIVLLTAHAAYRVGSAYWVYYHFEDAIQEVAQFGGNSTDTEIRARVMKAAAETGVPLKAEGIDVRKTQAKLFIDASYDTRLEVLPRYYYPWTFTASVSAWIRP
jgi:hypothetical protein